MLTPTIIVAEQGELWLAALRMCVRRSSAACSELTWLHVKVRQEVAGAVGRCGAPFAVLEVSCQSAASDVLELDRLREAFPRACFVAAIERYPDLTRIRQIALALREAGAAHVLTSPRRAWEVLPLLERHWRRSRTVGGVSHAGWTELVTSASSHGVPPLPSCWKADVKEQGSRSGA